MELGGRIPPEYESPMWQKSVMSIKYYENFISDKPKISLNFLGVNINLYVVYY